MRALGVIVLGFWLCWCGYKFGKNTADEWYAKHQSVASTPQVVDVCNGITLIAPTRAKDSQPKAQIEEPKEQK